MNIPRFLIHRDDAEIWTGIMESLQKEQQVVKEVSVTYQCGMKIKSGTKIMEWDILEFLIMQDKK